MFARAGWSSSPIHIPTLKAASRLINDRVARYLGQYQPELFVDFQKIADWKVDVCSFPKTFARSEFFSGSGRASQQFFVELAVSGLASMYPGSDWSVLRFRPSWVSARVRSHSRTGLNGPVRQEFTFTASRPFTSQVDGAFPSSGGLTITLPLRLKTR
jgi:hypothetical protein